MVHTLKKYLSNRGSALFMVLSTMTALMICCMAMYFSIVSSRSTQYAIFNQQLAHQSALGISDTLISELYNSSSTSDFRKIGDLLADMDKVGDKKTTYANGFAEFGDTSGSGKDVDRAGAYMMTITRLNDETDGSGKKYKVFDIVITSSVNGTKEAVHNIINLYETPGTKPPSGPTNVFTATGYVPNDVYLDGGNMKTDVFFDNQNTILKAYTSSDLTLDGNISCGGSLMINSKILTNAKFPVTYAIRGNYNNKASGEIGLKSGSVVMIGGNCEGKSHFGNSKIYILGNLILDESTSISSSSKYFVSGNIICKGGDSKWFNLSNMYCNGTVDTSQLKGSSAWSCGISNPIAGTWDEEGVKIDGVMTKAEMINLLDSKTQTNTYYKWIIDSSKLTGGTKTLEYNVDNRLAEEKNYTEYIAYGEDGTGCTIKDITMKYGGQGSYHSLTLVIDTLDDPDNVYTINLSGNRNWLPGKVDKETFCWFPKNEYPDPGWKGCDTYQENGLQIKFQVLIMGRGSVLFNVPDGVIYQDDDSMKVMHYGWYVLDPANTETFLGTTKTGLTKREIVENTVYSHAEGNSAANIYPNYIHVGCREGDGCTYTESDTTEECSVCGKKTVQVKCDDHGVVDTYCKECQPNRGKSANCSNRVDKKAIDTYLASHSGAKDRMLGKDGEVIYPNVNLFIISCDENANIRFATAATADPTDTPEQFIQNSFFGYIYAPYMTFKALSTSSSGGSYIRLAGGMTVSDYIIDDSYTMLAIWPDKIPEELMSDESFEHILPGYDPKPWKISLVGR